MSKMYEDLMFSINEAIEDVQASENKLKTNKDCLIDLRKSTGMNRKEFCEYFEIPYRTMTDWELGHRTMPDYLLRLMAYKVEMEKLTESKRE